MSRLVMADVRRYFIIVCVLIDAEMLPEIRHRGLSRLLRQRRIRNNVNDSALAVPRHRVVAGTTELTVPPKRSSGIDDHGEMVLNVGRKRSDEFHTGITIVVVVLLSRKDADGTAGGPSINGWLQLLPLSGLVGEQRIVLPATRVQRQMCGETSLADGVLP